MNIIPLFPKVVCSTSIDNPITRQQLHFMLSQKRRPNKGNTTSENTYILESDELKSLKNKLMAPVEEYFYSINCYDRNLVKPYITQSWVNYTEPGEYHHQHTHANSLLSGVLYIHGGGEADRITFYRDPTELDILPVTWNEWNSKSWWFSADTGTLFIFPSNLSHGVEPTKSDSTRISLAFNVFIRGTIGERQNLTELNL